MQVSDFDFGRYANRKAWQNIWTKWLWAAYLSNFPNPLCKSILLVLLLLWYSKTSQQRSRNSASSRQGFLEVALQFFHAPLSNKNDCMLWRKNARTEKHSRRAFVCNFLTLDLANIHSDSNKKVCFMSTMQLLSRILRLT